jgi:ABC-type transporter lipoprotein component MlaA
VIDSSYDPYAFVRNAWLQRREYQVRGGNAPEALLPEEDSGRKPPEDNNGPPIP